MFALDCPVAGSTLLVSAEDSEPQGWLSGADLDVWASWMESHSLDDSVGLAGVAQALAGQRAKDCWAPKAKECLGLDSGALVAQQQERRALWYPLENSAAQAPARWMVPSPQAVWTQGSQQARVVHPDRGQQQREELAGQRLRTSTRAVSHRGTAQSMYDD